MAEVEIKIKNLAQIKAAFNKSPLLMIRELNKTIQTVVYKIGRGSRENTPVDTGRLRASHYERFGNLRGEVGTNTAYDIFVHEGTKFMKERPYLRRAVEGNQSIVDREFKGAVDRVLDDIGRAT